MNNTVHSTWLKIKHIKIVLFFYTQQNPNIVDLVFLFLTSETSYGIIKWIALHCFS